METPTRYPDRVPPEVIAELGAYKGSVGTICDRLGDWSEQSFERGAVRSVTPYANSRERRPTGARYYLVWKYCPTR